MIYYSVPFDAAKNIGAYYNAFMRLLPTDDDFACFIDRDAMFTTPNYGVQIQEIVKQNHDCGLFTAVASRIGCNYQRAGNWETDDMNEHMRIGAGIQQQHRLTTTDITVDAETNPLGGVLILIRKSTWKKAGGFPESGMLGIDNSIHRSVAATGEKVLLMNGVYLYHWYRGGNVRDKKHLETKTIYTAIFGNYDTLKDPAVVNHSWNYVCFTDNPSLKSNVWRIVHVPSSTPILTAGRYKILFHQFIKSQHVVWVDASISINCDPETLIGTADFMLMKHPHRSCIYEEARACIKLRKDDESIINAQVNRYRSEGYRNSSGLVATGIIYRKATKQINKFCEQWFSEVERGSIRDQLSFNYVAWKTGMGYALMDYVPAPHFKLNRHNK